MGRLKRGKVDGWPVIFLDRVFHIGTLDPSKKGTTHNACSHEGTGLSVSLHPEAWMRIAKLGGNPTWELESESKQAFIDVLNLKAIHWQTINDWAVNKGLLEQYEATVVSYFDDDLGYEVSLQFDPRDPNEKAEIDWYIEEDGDKVALKSASAFRGTKLLNEKMGYKVPKGLSADLAMTLFCEDILADRLHTTGIWWNEILEPLSYSAPRGVIHVKALEKWIPQEIQEERNKERQH
jgi:hypothetical protein